MVRPLFPVAVVLVLAASAHGQAPGTQIWEFVTTGRISSSPALGTNGVVYFGCNNRVFYALNSTNGAKLWEYETESGIQSSPAIGFDGALYFGSDDFKVYALNLDGSKRWEFATGAPVQSSPAIGIDGTIYIGSDDFHLYALRPDGSERWRFPTGGRVSHGIALGVDGTIYFGATDTNLYALTTNGTLRWKTTVCTNCPDATSVVTPTIAADRTIYVVVGHGLLAAINPSGSLQWTFPYSETYYDCAPVVGSDGSIYINGGVTLTAFASDGFRKWSYSNGSGGYGSSSPVIGSDGTIYVADDDGSIFAITPAGTRLWASQGFPNRGYPYLSSPVIGPNGVVYVGLGNKLVAVMGTGSGLAESPWPMFQKNPAHTARNQVAASNSVAAELAITTLPGLTITGTVGRNYRIDYRESVGDTNTWHTLTNIVLPASPWLFVDTRATVSRRFYRAVGE